MKRFLKPSELSFVALCGGLLTLIVRLWLMIMGKDERGLLSVGSLPDLLSWLIVAATMGLLIVGVRPIQGNVQFSRKSHNSLFAAIAMAVAALCFCITSAMELLSETDSMSLISAWLGFLAAAALILLAWGRFKGISFNMIPHGLVCVYLMLHLVSHYRLWSAYPHLQSYGFELLAIVFVMLACYHRAAADAGHGNRRAYTFFTLASLFFCIAAIPSSCNIAFFLGCAVWMYFTPCRLSSSSRKEE